ncbi:MAG TPA: periplasmic heavy metal sensor [Acidobacteriaceae bacterium]|nr:periplasmic heavy metal sensor [Acidobacteriaceae bacterium]
MKRIILWSSVGVLLLAMTFVVFRVHAGIRRGWGGHGWHRGGPMSYVAHELKLSSDQRAQIRALWEAERPGVATHVHELLAENKEMNAATVQEKPDPTKVKEIADREAATIAALLVEKQQLQAKIYTTVLNPEQRAKADAWEKKWESRLDRAAERLGK